MTTPAERVRAWIAVYEANSPDAEQDRIGASYESAPLLLSDLKALAEPLGTLAEPEGSILDAAMRVADWIDILPDKNPAAAMSLQADDLRRLVDHARQHHTIVHAESEGIRKAADRVRVMLNGGAPHGKALVWGLLDWADEVDPEQPKPPKAALDRIAAKLVDAEALKTPNVILTYEDAEDLFWAAVRAKS